MNLCNFVDPNSRRKALEKELGLNLSHIGSYSLDEQQAATKNCENMIGAVQVPLGIAGPLKISNFKFQISNEYYVPLATTEGALVASINRGCKTISESGGATVASQKVGITRAPVFRIKNIDEGVKLRDWIESHFSEIKKIAESTSSHLALLTIKTWMSGRSFYTRFSYDTTDAMGMNMATIATEAVAAFIEKGTKAHLVAISGNMCVDKKANYLNFIEGRGYSVWAEAVIPETIIASVLKTGKSKILEVAERKLHQASIMSGTIGANAHMANVLAAIFLATGQDIAHVAECATGVTTVENDKDGLYVSVYLPDLVVGTVGGGTHLATQKEALQILGLDALNEKNTGQKLAEIIAGAVLAGEISLLASLAEGSLTQAHKKFARGV